VVQSNSEAEEARLREQ